MKVRDVCKLRQISVINESTPIIVPSFSSRGFPFIGNIHSDTKRYLSKASLVSAFDIYYSSIFEDEIYASDVLFIDSGGYEAKPVPDFAEAYIDERSSRGWSRDNYEAVLGRLQPLSQLVVVNYDYAAPQAIKIQVGFAKELFQKFPNYATNFLYKPEVQGTNLIGVDSLINNIPLIDSFSILGITEKELGNSLFDRCRNLLQIRTALLNAGVEIPVHIFGCLDPSVMIAYFLCGADIFDGLAWLRYTIEDGLVAYHSTATLLREEWSITEDDLLITRWLSNLEYFENLNRGMKRFCRTRSVSEFSINQNLIMKVLSLVKLLGIEVDGGS